MISIWTSARHRRMFGLVCVAAFGSLTGCHHHRRVVPVLAPVLQAPDAPPPVPAAPTMEVPPPQSISNAPSVKVTETAKRKKTPKKSSSKPPADDASAAAPFAAPATTPAAEAPVTPVVSQAPTPQPSTTQTPAPVTIPMGELSSGGATSDKTEQDAAALIAVDEKRLERLPASPTDQEKSSIRQVRHFLAEAKQALGTGDAEGAKTLATKAKLLLDDLAK